MYKRQMPLPGYFMDDKKFLDECSPNEEQIEKYFKELKNIKVKYKNKIKINSGLEVDFIEGYEDKTTELLNKYGENLEDAILSVHFIKLENGEYTDIDLSLIHILMVYTLFHIHSLTLLVFLILCNNLLWHFYYQENCLGIS